jgi:hypothetical protein
MSDCYLCPPHADEEYLGFDINEGLTICANIRIENTAPGFLRKSVIGQREILG